MKIKVIGIIGDSAEKDELNSVAEELGYKLAESGYSILSGGRQGVMGAASRGASSCVNRPASSRVIGILPGIDKMEGNEQLDYAIPTGIGWARNQIVVLSSDLVVVVGGSAGTLSEISYAWAYNKPIIAFSNLPGWSSKLAGAYIDDKRKDSIISVKTVSEALEKIKDIVSLD